MPSSSKLGSNWSCSPSAVLNWLSQSDDEGEFLWSKYTIISIYIYCYQGGNHIILLHHIINVIVTHLTHCLKSLHNVIVYPLHYIVRAKWHWQIWICMYHPPLSILIYRRSRDNRLMWSGRLLDPLLDHHPVFEYLFHQPHSCYHVFSTNMASHLLAHLCNRLYWVVDSAVKGPHSLHRTLTILTKTLSTSEVPYLITITGGGNLSAVCNVAEVSNVWYKSGA